jgi:DNA-directed RNA polymerase specialized sigma24 family protein
VATLGPKQREVFVLIDIEGMSGPEAARALRESVNVVYSRLRLARGRFTEFVAAAVSDDAAHEGIAG